VAAGGDGKLGLRGLLGMGAIYSDRVMCRRRINVGQS
jgi:hypothetical protein